MKGFKDLVKRPDLFEQLKGKPCASLQESQVLTEILSKLDEKKSEHGVELVVDHRKKDIGIMIKLHNLQKRVNFINHVLGGWKPSAKYQTLTS